MAGVGAGVRSSSILPPPRGGFFAISATQAHIALTCSNMACRERYRLQIKLTGKKEGVMAHPDDEPKKSSSYDPMDYLDK